MNLIERATILHFHRHRIATYGLDAVEALGWRGYQSQRVRFEVIARAADFNGCSVLDLGCGTGDLLAFLRERCVGLRYLGVDQMSEFIEVARERFAGVPDAAFALAYFDTQELPHADIVVACGALGYGTEDPHWIFNVIARMYAVARSVLVFNVLDARTFPQHPLLAGHNVHDVSAFCHKLAPDVERVEGYAPDDVTFVLRRLRRSGN